MNREFVLGAIANLMGWSDEESRREFAWLRLMSRMKYDDYQEFLAGSRFIESLADWLQQFPAERRAQAYGFIRSKLVFFSEAELRHLVALLYSETIEPNLLTRTSELTATPRYETWSNQAAATTFRSLLRKTIFVELSDGARIDIFRRVNEGRISNEQVITAPRINQAKWDDMLKDLRSDLDDDQARFAYVVLVDDFTGSGASLIRYEDGAWKGKLQRFLEDVTTGYVSDTHFEPDWRLIVHHYVATAQAVESVVERNAARREDTDAGAWFKSVQFTWGMQLPADFKLTPESVPEFAKLAEEFYDDSIETRHMKVGGNDGRWGFGSCGLPLIMEHNTPNNSIALLWAETDGEKDQHAMRPLFRRRQRHL
ncbi:MAG: hypothetical protein R3C59_21270 [Planctomycetaceae bacterium]